MEHEPLRSAELQPNRIESLQLAFHGLRANLLERRIANSFERQEQAEISADVADAIGTIAVEAAGDLDARPNNVEVAEPKPFTQKLAKAQDYYVEASIQSANDYAQDEILVNDAAARGETEPERFFGETARLRKAAEAAAEASRVTPPLENQPQTKAERDLAFKVAKAADKLTDKRKDQAARRSSQGTGSRPRTKIMTKVLNHSVRKKVYDEAVERFENGEITAADLVATKKHIKQHEYQTTDRDGVPTLRVMIKEERKLDKKSEKLHGIADKHEDKAVDKYNKELDKQEKLADKLAARITKMNEIERRVRERNAEDDEE